MKLNTDCACVCVCVSSGRQLNCCGAVGPQDYKFSEWFNRTRKTEALFVPPRTGRESRSGSESLLESGSESGSTSESGSDWSVRLRSVWSPG